ncbi:MAG: pilus assembly protein TadG-related protein [Planctomycetota bacterium]
MERMQLEGRSVEPAVRRCDPRRGGMSLIYATLALFVLMGMAVLAIDVGSVQLERSKMQSAVDAATLYGVTGLDINSAEVRKRVRDSLADNPMFRDADGNGVALKVSNANIEFGIWDAHTRSFTPTGNPANATALRVTADVNADGNTGMKSYFARFFGETKFEATLSATATRGKAVPLEVHAVASPYMAGMPKGTKIPFTFYEGKKGRKWDMEDYDFDGDGEDDLYDQNEDPAKWEKAIKAKKDASGNLKKKQYLTPSHSTIERCAAYRVDIPVKPGQVLYFRDVNGVTGDYNSGGQKYGLDGNEGRPNIIQSDVNGYAGMRGPLNALTGVFLTDDQPDKTGYVPGLDFSSRSARNYDELRPENKQIFHIGDGLNNDADRLQRIVVPDGATRLYLGMQDEYGFWWDNFGSIKTNVFVGKPVLVD